MLFLHIPKTAGTSLKRFLYHQVSAQACLLDPSLPATLEEGELDRYQLVAGHLDYDFVGRYRRRPFVLTSLRHPVDRALSAYYYQRTPRLAIQIRSIAPQIGEAAAERILDDLRRVERHGTLRDFLRAEPDLARKTLGNVQTEYLAGAGTVAAHGAEPDRLLAVAREHLQACDGLLLAERLPETLALINPEWGERARTSLPSDNTTPDRRPMREHAPDELEALAELTSLDLDLYRYAEQLIEQSGKIARPRNPFSVALPEAADYTFDQPIHGHGWHVRELRDGDWYCWTDRDAALTLKLASAGDHELHCDVKYAASGDAWADLAVSVNGHPVALTSKPDVPPGRITARIPGHWLGQSPGQVSIGFRVAHTVRPSDLDSNNPDTRRLGIALSRVRLVPASPLP
jgi:hypothetical protein